jgi:hypothetical protein
MDIHCVVSGHNQSGKSVVVRNTPIKPLTLAFLPGSNFIAFGAAILTLNFPRAALLPRALAISPQPMVRG